MPQPYWNHNGGTVIFGPDGYLYLSVGDGGDGNDPHNVGQSGHFLLAKILRLDVNSRTGNLPYGIPKDNPFVGVEDDGNQRPIHSTRAQRASGRRFGHTACGMFGE